MSVGNYVEMTNFGGCSLVSSAREDGPNERGHYGTAGEFRKAQTATRDRMMWRILFLFPLLAFSCAMVLQRLYYSITGWLRGFRRFYSLGFLFLFERAWWWARAGSSHILTQKWSCETARRRDLISSYVYSIYPLLLLLSSSNWPSTLLQHSLCDG